MGLTPTVGEPSDKAIRRVTPKQRLRKKRELDAALVKIFYTCLRFLKSS